MTPNDTEKGRAREYVLLGEHIFDMEPYEGGVKVCVYDTGMVSLPVIEKSFYDRCLAERDELNEAIHDAREALNAKSEDLVTDIEWLKEERDEARAEVERWRNECTRKDGSQLSRRLAEQSALLDCAVAALERVSKIRTLPLTDIHDTDEERAGQYSSVIDVLVHIAKDALTKITAARKE